MFRVDSLSSHLQKWSPFKVHYVSQPCYHSVEVVENLSGMFSVAAFKEVSKHQNQKHHIRTIAAMYFFHKSVFTLLKGVQRSGKKVYIFF